MRRDIGNKRAFLICFFLFPFCITSCASYTIIRSEPDRAKVFIDGEPKGQTPYVHEDRGIIFSKTSVRLEKDGYETSEYSFRRNEKFSIGSFVAGLFTVVPWFWVLDYQHEHFTTLRKL